MNRFLGNSIIGALCLCIAIAGCVVYISSDRRDQQLQVFDVPDEQFFERERMIRDFLRRAALDASSHRNSRERRALDAARRAAQGDVKLMNLVQDYRGKAKD